MLLPTLLLSTTLAAGPGGVTVTTGDFDGNGSADLLVVGNRKRNVVDVADLPGTSMVRVRWDGDADGQIGVADPSIDFAGPIETVEIRLGSGNDVLTIEPDNPDMLADGARRFFEIDLGAGKDSLVVDAAPIGITGTSLLRFDVNGGSGRDELELDLDCAISEGSVELGVDAGGGRDLVLLRLPYFLHDGAQFSIDADLGDGDDEFHSILAGLDTDSAAHIRCDIDGGDGDDGILLQPSENVVSRVLNGSLEFDARGGSGDDLISFNVATPNAIDFPQLATARLRARLDGGADEDFVNFACANTSVDEPVYDVQVNGGSGDDSLLANIANPNATGNDADNYGVAGSVLLIGGPGHDEAVTMGNGRYRSIAVP